MMVRYLTPYLLVAAAFTIAAGVAYGTAAIDAPAMYALLIIGTVIANVGYMRWDERQHPDSR